MALAALLGAYACGGDGIVLPDESVPAVIEVVSGNGQAAPAGATLAQALVVQVTDVRGRPVADHEVGFSVVNGGGQITPGSAATNADGVASATWTLGPGTGVQQARAQVTSDEAPEDLLVEFTATAVSGEGSTLVMVSGDGQSGAVGSALGSPLVVRVVDPLGNPVSGQTVNWSVVGGGSIGPTSSVTGEDGLASAQRVLGPTAGTQSALATAEGLAGSPVTFTHTASASNPTAFVRVSGNGQSAPAGFQLPESLVVRLLDVNGNGVGGRTVTWVVAPSAGAVDPVNSQTDADGYAVTRWTLGSAAGSYSLNAVFSGLPSLTFTATATADAPTTLALLSGDNQTGAVGTTLSAPLRVRVTDANGNGVENVSVTWAPQGGGSVSSTTSGTNAQGVAEVSRTLGPTPGTQTTTATVAGLAGSPVTFTSTAEVGPAARLAFLTQPAGAQVGQALPAFQVEVQDAQGNRVTTATNQVTITSSVAGTLQGDNTENAVSGVATFGELALDQAGTYRLTARASGLTNAVSEPFDVAQGATTIAITGRSPTSSVTGQTVTISYDVSVVAPAAGGLSGTVTVSDGQGGSCTGGVTAGGGTGSCSIAFASAGARTLTATYAGNANFTGSTSAGVGHTVAKASTTVSVTGDSPDPSAVGQEITVEYQVTVNSPGGGTPSGNVVITVSGGSETCTGLVSAGSCTLTLQGSGDRSITATYPGDANYNGDTDAEAHDVRAATTTTVTTSKGTTVFGESVTFTATVAPVPPGGGAPGGTVQFKANGVNLGGPVTLNGAGVAIRTTSGLAVGTHVITAEYSGSGSFAASSGTLSGGQTVGQAGTTTTITGEDPEESNPDQSYSVRVSVAAVPPGGGTPGGSVTVSDGEGRSCTATLSGGSGSCQLSSATPGVKTLTATYSGDANFSASSGTASHEVNAPPTGTADFYEVPAELPFGEDAPGVLGNDTDPDGDSPLTAVLETDVSNGDLLLSADGSFLYSPESGFTGTDSFTYRVNDGLAASAPVTVTLQVGS